MQILRDSLTELNIDKDGLAIALGTFDGVHLGHSALLNKLIEISKQDNLNSLVYTFDELPLNVLFNESKIKIIMTQAEKEDAISNFEIDYLYIKHFDPQYADMSYKDFIKLLLTFPKLKHIIVGFNFTFGYKAEGSSSILKSMLEKAGVKVTVIPPVLYDNIPVSSSKIRNYISDGEVECVSKLLGQPYSIESIVVQGKQLGNTLGFPTANINYDSTKALPKPGVYITLTEVDGKSFPSISNVGYNPTVESNNNKKIKIETNLLDYSDSLYGEKIRVYFIKKVRDEKTFRSLEDLKEQITKDVHTARKYFDLL